MVTETSLLEFFFLLQFPDFWLSADVASRVSLFHLIVLQEIGYKMA